MEDNKASHCRVGARAMATSGSSALLLHCSSAVIRAGKVSPLWAICQARPIITTCAMMGAASSMKSS